MEPELFWFRNPGQKGLAKGWKWDKQLLVKARGENEAFDLRDLDGDGDETIDAGERITGPRYASAADSPVAAGRASTGARRPKRRRRSVTGMIFPRRLMTPLMCAGILGTGVMGHRRMISRTTE